ncbi:MAG: epoxyqueuosine reductase QueH, partial [Sphaerochaetaceae bacterium]|nr:epoxyqueuosine reductase QueH [Sphaerochaetaceae bacterium]
MNGERTILVHVCCGPCATSSIERLLEEGWSPILFFSDSNIWPEEEFEKRYENLLIVAKRYSLPVVKDHY